MTVEELFKLLVKRVKADYMAALGDTSALGGVAQALIDAYVNIGNNESSSLARAIVAKDIALGLIPGPLMAWETRLGLDPKLPVGLPIVPLTCDNGHNYRIGSLIFVRNMGSTVCFDTSGNTGNNMDYNQSAWRLAEDSEIDALRLNTAKLMPLLAKLKATYPDTPDIDLGL